MEISLINIYTKVPYWLKSSWEKIEKKEKIYKKRSEKRKKKTNKKHTRTNDEEQS